MYHQWEKYFNDQYLWCYVLELNWIIVSFLCISHVDHWSILFFYCFVCLLLDEGILFFSPSDLAWFIIVLMILTNELKHIDIQWLWNSFNWKTNNLSQLLWIEFKLKWTCSFILNSSSLVFSLKETWSVILNRIINRDSLTTSIEFRESCRFFFWFEIKATEVWWIFGTTKIIQRWTIDNSCFNRKHIRINQYRTETYRSIRCENERTQKDDDEGVCFAKAYVGCKQGMRIQRLLNLSVFISKHNHDKDKWIFDIVCFYSQRIDVPPPTDTMASIFLCIKSKNETILLDCQQYQSHDFARKNGEQIPFVSGTDCS